MDNSLMMLLPLIMGQKNPDMMNLMRTMGGMGGMGGMQGANPMSAFGNFFNSGGNNTAESGNAGSGKAENGNIGGMPNNIMSILSAMNQNKSPDMASMMMSMMNGQNKPVEQPQNVGHGFMPLNGISTDLINQLILNLIFTSKVK